MPTITTRDGAQIFYKDWGTGQPIVFSHGWPLNADLLEFIGQPSRAATPSLRSTVDATAARAGRSP